MKFNKLFAPYALLFSVLVLMSSCLSTRPDFIPTPRELPTYHKGHYFQGTIIVDQEEDNDRPYKEIYGEMIYITDTTLALFSKEEGLNKFSLDQIVRGEVVVSMLTNGEEKDFLTTMQIVSIVATIPHGLLWVFTVPINAGVIASTSAKYNGHYSLIFNETPRGALAKFCRFPQGLPDVVNEDTIEYIK